MQFPGRERPPVLGVIYNTTLKRPDAALTLALLYELESAREMQVGAISVTENSFGAAAFVDAVYHFYQLGPTGNGNRVLRTGLAAEGKLPEDSKMVLAALSRVKEDGTPAYERSIKRISDTAEPSAQMRNALAFFQDGWVNWIVSAPATYVAKILDYQGTKELIEAKVRTLIVTEQDQDVTAMRRLLADWPSPIVFVGKETGEAVPYPASSIENDFEWAPMHPVVDFYKAYADMPYDTPSLDLVAAFYAIRTDSEFFAEPEAGTLEVLDNGKMKFTPMAGGKHKRVVINMEKKDDFIFALKEAVSAAPVPPPQRRGRPPGANQAAAAVAAEAQAEQQKAAEAAAADAAVE